MSLSDLAAIGSFLSGMAVIATLIFLLLQLRQTAKNQKALLQQGRSARVTELILKRTEPELSKALTKGLHGDLAIADHEMETMTAFFGAFFWSLEDSFLQFRAGLLLASSWQTDEATLRGFFAIPACRVAWLMNRDLMSGAYRDHVDALMRDVRAIPPSDRLATWRRLMSEELAAVA